jgi:hypothetical protein
MPRRRGDEAWHRRRKTRKLSPALGLRVRQIYTVERLDGMEKKLGDVARLVTRRVETNCRREIYL